MKDSDKLFIVGTSSVIAVFIALVILSMLLLKTLVFLFATPALSCVLFQVLFLSIAWAREEREQKNAVWLPQGDS